MGIHQGRARIALLHRTPLGRAVAEAIAEQGPQVVAEGARALTAHADLLVVAEPLWELGLVEASAARAKAILFVSPPQLMLAAEERLHDRGIVIVPDTLAGAGAVLALHLSARGVDERSALARTSATVGQRTRELLDASASASAPLSAVARAAVAARTRRVEPSRKDGAVLPS
jgi:glutamate dehydrogenase/leucine dehydrogenase